MPTPIQAVIFDIGGVLIRTEDWSPRRRWEERLGLPERGLSAAVFDSEVALRAAIGQATDEDVWRYVGNRFALDPQQLGQLQMDFWSGDRLDVDLCQFLADLRPRFKTGILSNTWPHMPATNKRLFGFDAPVDAAVYSFNEGITKPSPHIYRVALERLGVRPEQAVFVDDFIENIDAAREVGMPAVWFRSREQAVTELQRYFGGNVSES
ncbi:MAG: HAD family phosphatase [Chloroflexi bacterium]|nr:HAD family phosphatase [Chloroflexota bacterium]